MSRVKEWKPHGTVSRYRQGGCNDVLNDGEPGTGDRCSGCKAAMSEYNSQRMSGMAPDERRPVDTVTSISGRRNSKSAGVGSNSRPSQSTRDGSSLNTEQMGPTERAVIQQLEQYRHEHPVLFELALSAARDLDNADARNLYRAARRDMNEIIDKLTAKKKTKSGGRLATVSAMAGRRAR
jgi:hypothetical protein